MGLAPQLAARLPGGDQRRCRRRVPVVYPQLRTGRWRHSARQVRCRPRGREGWGALVKWTDSEDIGIALFERFPAVDPLTVRFTDLREKVMQLDGFDDDPKSSNEPKLEAIQMAWYEEWKEDQ